MTKDKPLTQTFPPSKKTHTYTHTHTYTGNDVATGLKWMLASNSVVLMPSPRREIWSHESLLQPYVHYIPLKADMCDLLEKIVECEKDLYVCECVSQRATAYMRGFNDSMVTYRQGARRLKEYLEKVTIEVVGE